MGDDGFVWVDGSSIIAGDYTNWVDDEPSNNQLENCVLMMGLLDGNWKDYACGGPMQYICQRKVGKYIYIYKLSINPADKIYLLKFATVCFTVKTAHQAII